MTNHNDCLEAKFSGESIQVGSVVFAGLAVVWLIGITVAALVKTKDSIARVKAASNEIPDTPKAPGGV